MTPYEKQELENELEELYDLLNNVEDRINEIEIMLGEQSIEFEPDFENFEQSDAPDYNPFDEEER